MAKLPGLPRCVWIMHSSVPSQNNEAIKWITKEPHASSQLLQKLSGLLKWAAEP